MLHEGETSSANNHNRIGLSDADIIAGLSDAYYRPLCPDDRDQGDPYILEVPEGAGTDYRFYIYTSGEQSDSGTAIPCYASNDLRQVEFLGMCLVDEAPRCHWAPCVSYLPFLPHPYVMLYSRSVGLGEQAHVGHQIVRAQSKDPGGPFVESGHVLTPEDDFAIDPDVFTLPDGTTTLAFATDFVEDEPLGTGIVEAPVSADLTRLWGPRTVLARARTELQVYEEARVMPWKRVPGVQWVRGDAVRWYTVEAPVYLVSPQGRPTFLYSTGAYFKDNYAVGALIGDDSHGWFDITAEEDHFVIRSQPESGIYSLGHPSVLHLGGGDFLIIHMRMGSVDAARQMTIVPLHWTAGGLPFCPPATELRG